MHMHFNGITGDLFVPGISFSSISLRGSTRPALRISNSAGQILLVSALRVRQPAWRYFAGVEHDVAVAQLVAGLAVGRRIRASSLAATSINAKGLHNNRQLPDAALLHVPPAHRARQDQYRLTLTFFSPFAQNIATSMPGKVKSRITAS